MTMMVGMPFYARAAISRRTARRACFLKTDARDPPPSLSARACNLYLSTHSGGCTTALVQDPIHPATPLPSLRFQTRSRARSNQPRIVTLSSRGTTLWNPPVHTGVDSAGWTTSSRCELWPSGRGFRFPSSAQRTLSHGCQECHGRTYRRPNTRNSGPRSRRLSPECHPWYTRLGTSIALKCTADPARSTRWSAAQDHPGKRALCTPKRVQCSQRPPMASCASTHTVTDGC